MGAAALLLDVMTRVAGLSEAIGCRSFYEHLIPEFEPGPSGHGAASHSIQTRRGNAFA